MSSACHCALLRPGLIVYKATRTSTARRTLYFTGPKNPNSSTPYHAPNSSESSNTPIEIPKTDKNYRMTGLSNLPDPKLANSELHKRSRKFTVVTKVWPIQLASVMKRLWCGKRDNVAAIKIPKG